MIPILIKGELSLARLLCTLFFSSHHLFSVIAQRGVVMKPTAEMNIGKLSEEKTSQRWFRPITTTWKIPLLVQYRLHSFLIVNLTLLWPNNSRYSYSSFHTFNSMKLLIILA